MGTLALKNSNKPQNINNYSFSKVHVYLSPHNNKSQQFKKNFSKSINKGMCSNQSMTS